ncbi:sensor histidine kinase [Algoriphagus sanaruensis]|nr:HAMP domain-containing sensor histidine kinase [Algoriphagus sanaruensis]
MKNLESSAMPLSDKEISKIFLDQSEDFILFFNEQMEIEYLSDAFEFTLDFKKENLLGKKLNEVWVNFPSLPLMKPEQKMVIPITSAVSKQKFLIEFKFRIITDLEEYPDRIFCAIGRDVTDRELALKKFKDIAFKEKELNQMKSRFVSMASHEFKTPIATIVSSINIMELLLQKEFNEEIKSRLYNHIEKITNQTSRLTDILGDVLLLEKTIQLGGGLIGQKISILKFITQLVNAMNDENFGRRHIRLFAPDKDQFILSDPTLLTHVFRNLIQNALNYSPGSVDPEVHLIYRGSFVEVMVKDYGIGIPKEDRKNIFGSFYRGSNVGNIKGTGLGLNIVWELVKKLNGEIWFESKVGLGSEFHVSLPSK